VTALEQRLPSNGRPCPLLCAGCEAGPGLRQPGRVRGIPLDDGALDADILKYVLALSDRDRAGFRPARRRPAGPYARASSSKISALVLQRFISSSSLVIASCECRPARPRRSMCSRGTISAG
jgi:hypothetical protein